MIAERAAKKKALARSRPMVSTVTSVPAPVGGWNARDPLANMKSEDAVSLDNWFPTTGDVMLRPGYVQHVTGISGQVETLMTHAGFTTGKIFAAAGSSFYDVTSSGAVGAAVVSGLTNARWQHVTFSNAGATYLCLVNGADAPRAYDGTTWTTPAITGVTASDLIHINHWKRRLWFVQKNTLRAWYLPTDAIAGAASLVDLGQVFKLGGYLMAIGTWTLDAGDGIDDYIVFITSKGEIAVYKGTDPASATTFGLQGVYRIGEPIGRRCFCKYGGDLVVVCKDGALPLSKALLSSAVNTKVALTDKIREAFKPSAISYGANFGWQPFVHPTQNALMINVPTAEGSLQHQYVMNTITGAWCRFKSWDANCWELNGDESYFGGNGFVGKAWSGQADNGNNINADGKQAFNYFGSRGRNKHFKMCRPIFSVTGTPAIRVGVNVDYEDVDVTGLVSAPATAAGVYGTAVYGSSLYGGGSVVFKKWLDLLKIGFCAALRVKASSKEGSIRWVATDFVYELGGVL